MNEIGNLLNPKFKSQRLIDNRQLCWSDDFMKSRANEIKIVQPFRDYAQSFFLNQIHIYFQLNNK